MNRAIVEAVVKVLKARFPNLTAEELIKLVFDIIEAIDEATRG